MFTNKPTNLESKHYHVQCLPLLKLCPRKGSIILVLSQDSFKWINLTKPDTHKTLKHHPIGLFHTHLQDLRAVMLNSCELLTPLSQFHVGRLLFIGIPEELNCMFLLFFPYLLRLNPDSDESPKPGWRSEQFINKHRGPSCRCGTRYNAWWLSTADLCLEGPNNNHQCTGHIRSSLTLLTIYQGLLLL